MHLVRFVAVPCLQALGVENSGSALRVRQRQEHLAAIHAAAVALAGEIGVGAPAEASHAIADESCGVPPTQAIAVV